MAVKAVNRFGWGQALGSYFIPVLLVICLCACVVFGLISMMGGAGGLEEIFDQIIPTP
jgi:hypothetical protein